MLVALAGIWGASYLFIRVASPVFGPFVLIELRVILAALVLSGYAVATHRLPDLRGNWRRFLALGALAGALPFTLIASAELYIPASLAAILNATTPLFMAGVAAVWLGERLTVKRAIGIVVGIVGVAILVGWSPVSLNGGVLFAVVTSLLGALCYALGGTFAGRHFRGVPSLTLAIGQQIGASVVLLPFALAALPRAHVTGIALANLLALALLSTGVAYLIYYPLLKSVGATKALSVTFLIPAFGVIWGAIFLHEAVGPGTLAGLVVILAGLTLVTGVRPLPARRA
jgi:drug/metabolite transporter (DMT)-like permease